MSNELSIAHLILNASPVVQFVIGLLVLASLSSWTMIFDRMRVLRRAKLEAEEFESRFWSGGDLAELYRQIERDGVDESRDGRDLPRRFSGVRPAAFERADRSHGGGAWRAALHAGGPEP